MQFLTLNSHVFFSLGGQTISSIFGFKFGNAVDYMDDQKKAEMRKNLGQLKLLIIDEISLVGANMLYRIHMRLSDIFQTDEEQVPFGGINVMLVGDLLQLPAIKQSQVFQSPEDEHCQGLQKVKPLWNEFKPMIEGAGPSGGGLGRTWKLHASSQSA